MKPARGIAAHAHKRIDHCLERIAALEKAIANPPRPRPKPRVETWEMDSPLNDLSSAQFRVTGPGVRIDPALVEAGIRGLAQLRNRTINGLRHEERVVYDDEATFVLGEVLPVLHERLVEAVARATFNVWANELVNDSPFDPPPWDANSDGAKAAWRGRAACIVECALIGGDR